MGFDITLHPFSTKEFKYYFEDVLIDESKITSRLEHIHTDDSEREFLKDAIYSRLQPLKSKVLSGQLEFENSIGFGMCAVFGFLHPYWYSRNGLITKLFELEELKQYVGNLTKLASDQNKDLFQKANGGLIGNYSSGVFIPDNSIDLVLNYISSQPGQKLAEDLLGGDNYNSFVTCLKYCSSNALHLLEASDLVVPFSGNTNTYPKNLRAFHLKNVDDQTNDAKKKVLEIDTNTDGKPKKGFWSVFKR
jgi:hypothetical protein